MDTNQIDTHLKSLSLHRMREKSGRFASSPSGHKQTVAMTCFSYS